jgi:hypothetical protein
MKGIYQIRLSQRVSFLTNGFLNDRSSCAWPVECSSLIRGGPAHLSSRHSPHRHEILVDGLTVVLEEHLASAGLGYQRTQAHPIAAFGGNS